jgi:Cu2+-exporting ATPase
MIVTANFQREAAASTEVAYAVVHHVPGRMRLQIPRLVSDKAYETRLLAAVQKLPSVSRARVNALAQSLVVHYHAPATGQEMVQNLQKAIQSAACAESAVTQPASKKSKIEKTVPIPYARRLGLPVLGLGLGAGAAVGFGLSPILVGGTILLAAMPIFRRTWQGIQEEKRLTVDFLDSTAIVLLTAQASFLAPAFIVGVIEGAELLRDWTARRSKTSQLNLLQDQARPVVVERAGVERQFGMDELEVDDVVLVYPGDQIPVDGRVLDGRAAIDQHRVTGDSIPVLCGAGDLVYASALVTEGWLRIQARQTGADTHVGQVMAAMQAVPETDTRVSNYARRVGNWAVVPTLLAGGLVLGASGSLPQATSIVNMDMGTGMRVSSPIAILAAQSDAARQGILIRSGQALEALSQIDTILFDKTATLTTGKASIVAVDTLVEGVSARQLISLAASAEAALAHPIAESIVRYAHAQEVELRPCTDWNYLPGLGVEARIGGRLVLVGNQLLLAEKGVPLAGAEMATANPLREAATAVYVAQDGELAGIIYCADPVRAESAAVLSQLRARQIETLLVSGDGRAITESVAASVGIAREQVMAEALPRQKLKLVQLLQQHGHRVAFVGDGVNDTAAMLQADVAISLGSATDIAQESAGIVLVNNRLQDLLAAMDIAAHAIRLLEQNKAIVVGTNASGILYALLTAMNPITAVAVNNGSALVAALNSLRPAGTTGHYSLP